MAGVAYDVNGNALAASITTIAGMSKWSTASLTTMSDMFLAANKINADLGKWDVSKVRSIRTAFQNANNFVGTGLSKWITSSLTDLAFTFNDADAMNADLGGWDVSKVTTLSSSFKNTAGFTGAGLDKWSVAAVKDMSNTFSGANALTSCNKRKIADAWASSAVFTATAYVAEWVDDTCTFAALTDATFKEASWDWVQDTTSATATWGALGDWDVSGVKDMSKAFSKDRSDKADGYSANGNPRVASFVGTGMAKWKTGSVTNLFATFYGAASMNSNFSGWEVSKVTSLYQTFRRAATFAGNGLSTWKTGSVTTLANTFEGAASLNNADLRNWEVSKVATMYATFSGASSFVGVGLDVWKTGSVTTLNDAFRGARSMNVHLGRWDVSSVVTMSKMFDGAAAFSGSGLDKWRTGLVTSLEGTFAEAGLTTVDLGTWDVSKVATMSGAFGGAAKFEGAGLDAWNTGLVTDLSLTFSKAAKFVGYGLEKWDVDKVTAMTGTFNGATSITSCNKRKIADAWAGSGVFTATSYDTDWSADTCPCAAGSTWSVTGNTPCTSCSTDATCAAGVKTACTITTDTVCKAPCTAAATWSASGYAPCTSCSTDATCGTGVKTACSPGSDIVCNGAVAPCVGGTSFSVSGKAPCTTCTAGSTCAAGVKQSCTTTTDTVCEVPCAEGSTWSATGNTPCTACAVDATCTAGVKTACTTTADTVCEVPSSPPSAAGVARVYSPLPDGLYALSDILVVLVEFNATIDASKATAVTLDVSLGHVAGSPGSASASTAENGAMVRPFSCVPCAGSDNGTRCERTLVCSYTIKERDSSLGPTAPYLCSSSLTTEPVGAIANADLMLPRAGSPLSLAAAHRIAVEWESYKGLPDAWKACDTSLSARSDWDLSPIESSDTTTTNTSASLVNNSTSSPAPVSPSSTTPASLPTIDSAVLCNADGRGCACRKDRMQAGKNGGSTAEVANLRFPNNSIACNDDATGCLGWWRGKGMWEGGYNHSDFIEACLDAGKAATTPPASSGSSQSSNQSLASSTVEPTSRFLPLWESRRVRCNSTASNDDFNVTCLALGNNTVSSTRIVFCRNPSHTAILSAVTDASRVCIQSKYDQNASGLQGAVPSSHFAAVDGNAVCSSCGCSGCRIARPLKLPGARSLRPSDASSNVRSRCSSVIVVPPPITPPAALPVLTVVAATSAAVLSGVVLVVVTVPSVIATASAGVSAVASSASAGVSAVSAGASGAATTSSVAASTTVGSMGALLIGQLHFITMQSQVAVEYTDSFSSYAVTYKWYNFQGWVLSPDWSANSSVSDGVAEEGRRLDSATEAPNGKAGKKKRGNQVGRGLASFCKKIGLKPEYLFLSTLALFTVLLGVVMFLSCVLWAADRFIKMRRRAAPGGLAAPLENPAVSFATMLGWRMQGLTLRACYHGFYAISSSAIFQVFLQASQSPPPSSTNTGGSPPSPKTADLGSSTAVAMLAILSFGMIIFVGGALSLRKSKAGDQRTQVVIGSLVVHFKPAYRLFWLVRPLQILVVALAMGLLSSHPVGQVAVIVAVHAVSLVVLLAARPFEGTAHLVVAVFVELLRLACCAMLFAVLETPSPGVELGSILLNTATIFLLCAVECVNFCTTARRRLKERWVGRKLAQKNLRAVEKAALHGATYQHDNAMHEAGGIDLEMPVKANPASSYLTSMEAAMRPKSANVDDPSHSGSMDSSRHASSDSAVGRRASLEGVQYVQYMNEEGIPYYYKASTGESLWELPELPGDLAWKTRCDGDDGEDEKSSHVPVVYVAEVKSMYRGTSEFANPAVTLGRTSARHRGKGSGSKPAGSGSFLSKAAAAAAAAAAQEETENRRLAAKNRPRVSLKKEIDWSPALPSPSTNTTRVVGDSSSRMSSRMVSHASSAIAKVEIDLDATPDDEGTGGRVSWGELPG